MFYLSYEGSRRTVDTDNCKGELLFQRYISFLVFIRVLGEVATYC